jgi:hypothetical protein
MLSRREGPLGAWSGFMRRDLRASFKGLIFALVPPFF